MWTGPELGYNNKTTRVWFLREWFLREQKHTSDGLWPRKPQRPQVEGVSGKKNSRSYVDPIYGRSYVGILI
jgi:hypothetical protein